MHVSAFGMDVCTRCGATTQDIVEGFADPECRMPEGVVSIKAAAMKRKADAVVGPIMKRLGFPPPA